VAASQRIAGGHGPLPNGPQCREYLDTRPHVCLFVLKNESAVVWIGDLVKKNSELLDVGRVVLGAQPVNLLLIQPNRIGHVDASSLGVGHAPRRLSARGEMRRSVRSKASAVASSVRSWARSDRRLIQPPRHEVVGGHLPARSVKRADAAQRRALEPALVDELGCGTQQRRLRRGAAWGLCSPEWVPSRRDRDDDNNFPGACQRRAIFVGHAPGNTGSASSGEEWVAARDRVQR